MPTYVYECESCHARREVLFRRSGSEEAPVCPCDPGKPMRKLPSRPPVRLGKDLIGGSWQR